MARPSKLPADAAVSGAGRVREDAIADVQGGAPFPY